MAYLHFTFTNTYNFQQWNQVKIVFNKHDPNNKACSTFIFFNFFYDSYVDKIVT